MGPHLTQCRLGRDLPPYQVTSSSNRKVGTVPFCGGAAGSPSNTMWSGPKPTSVLSFILIHLTVWPQYTNVTDRQTGQNRQDRQTTDRYHRANRFTNGRPKISYLCSKQLASRGGFSPNLLTRGSASGPRWGHSHQTQTPDPPIYSYNTCYFPQNLGCLDKTLHGISPMHLLLNSDNVLPTSTCLSCLAHLCHIHRVK